MKSRMFAGVLVLGALAAMGCNKSEEPAPGPATDKAPAAKAEAPKDDSWKKELEHSLVTPLVLTLEKGEEQNGITTVVANIEVPARLPYPVELVATAPHGGEIVEGAANETLSFHQAERISKVFKVKGPITLENPFKVVVKGQSKSGAVGLKAERQLPAQPELVLKPRNGPTMPGGRPPGPDPRRFQH